MSDLIDFTSTESRNVPGPKLASPLIPAPTTPTDLKNSETNVDSDGPQKLSETKTRKSWENNPFDTVLHQTMEYTRKKDDPFEMVLEKALKSENKRATPFRLEARNSPLDTSKLGVLPFDNTALSVPSIVIDSGLNDGFLRNSNDNNSTFSTLSNISDITKANSLTQNHSSFLSILSSGTINPGFLTSCSSDRFDSKKSKDKIYSSSISEMSNSLINRGFLASKSCDLDWSTDSVFSEDDKTSQLILHEAKSLAEMLDDFAHINKSKSSSDDLLSNSLSWMSELLPAFEDEPIVEDLIVLPTSPEVNLCKEKLDNTNQLVETINGSNLPRNSLKLEEDTVQISETEFVDPITSVHKADAVALLLDLRKIVAKENNSEANQLLENLEKVLGVQYKDNTELLAFCLQVPNNLAKDPAKSNNGLLTIENVKEEDPNRTQNDNLNVDSIHHVKETSQYDNITMYNLNSNETINKNGKSVAAVTTDKSDSFPDKTDIIIKDCCNKSNESPEKRDNCKNIKEASCDSPSNSLICDSGEKVAVDLLDNLSKLLSGQCQEPTTFRLIKNLGSVLNLISSNCNVEEDEQTNQCFAKYVESPTRSKSKSEREDCASALSKSISELTSKIKVSAHKSPLRRLSISQTTPTKIVTCTPLTTSKNKSQFKNVKKRFSSDPGFINSVCSKKGIDAGVQKTVEIRVQEANSIESSDQSREKNPTAIHAVKNKLKKNVESSVVSKKGPLKAIHPVGSMQRLGSTGKITVSTEGSITPPSSKKKSPLPVFTVVTSTPDSLCGESMERKSPKTKPVASSTPDIENSRTQKGKLKMSQSSKKRNLNCDISPVSTQENDVGNNCKIKDSPKRIAKLLSPRQTSSKSRQSESGLPRYVTSPRIVKRNSVCDSNNFERRSEYRYKSTQNLQKGSPISLRRDEDKRQASPLKESNKLISKIKGVKLRL